jgi:hypothetical protein
MQTVREWASQCHGVDAGLPAQFPCSARDGRTGRVGGTALGYDSQVMPEGRCGEHSLLTRAPAPYQSMVGAVGVGAASSGASSSEAETRPRGRPALERGEDSPEGAANP